MGDFYFNVLDFWFKSRYGFLDLLFIYYIFTANSVSGWVLLLCMWIATKVLIGNIWTEEATKRLAEKIKELKTKDGKNE